MEAVEPALSSLVITLSDLPELRAHALTHLGLRSDLELGQPMGRWVPAVLASTESAEAFRAIEHTPGVELLEVVFVELGDPQAV